MINDRRERVRLEQLKRAKEEKGDEDSRTPFIVEQMGEFKKPEEIKAMFEAEKKKQEDERLAREAALKQIKVEVIKERELSNGDTRDRL